MHKEDNDIGKNESKSVNKPNHLISEKSPYLLQHAYNPVDWHPWGEEAFRRAKQDDKPIFLSIGYSTCHWCHVMAHESFEDRDVAQLMNDALVSIKVDREERPDIDQIYMSVCQIMTGNGGWPLTIIMTPDKRPFFAATYIPKRGKFGQLGMMELIPRIKDLWIKNRKELLSSANKVIAYLRQSQMAGNQAKELDASILTKAYDSLIKIFDIQNGGFGSAPKFPAPHIMLFLLRYRRRSGNEIALEMVETTLEAMRLGGIYDHVGFGFHRYSTDSEWFVPHFEKMLYDQALLALAYTESFQATGKEKYAKTAREILEYVLRDLKSEDGGFYSAEDADSGGEEGKFYLWTADELKGLTEKEEYSLFIKVFDVQEGGNFEKLRNILRMRSSVEDAAAVLGIPEKDLKDRMEKVRLILFAVRESRVRPDKDDKILTDWNGLMIAALARAAFVLDEPKYAVAAKKAADFILRRMRRPDGRLFHRYRDDANILGNLDDYAFLIWGLTELYEAVFDIRYLKAALELNWDMLTHFWDNANGGLYFTPDDGEVLLVRQKGISDGSVPSGNSTAILNLLKLSHLTGNTELEEKANAIIRAFAETVNEHILGHTMFLVALDLALGPSFEVALVGSLEDDEILEMLKALRPRFMPNEALILVSEEDVHKISEFTRSLSKLHGKATAYVCSDYKCELPTNEISKMLELLDKAR